MNLDRLFLRLRYLWAFYKSTLWVTIPFGLVTGCIVFREKGIEEAVKVFMYFYTIWGLLGRNGYPFLKPTLAESEAALVHLIAHDPQCIHDFIATKGLVAGNKSFDDRTYIRFII